MLSHLTSSSSPFASSSAFLLHSVTGGSSAEPYLPGIQTDKQTSQVKPQISPQSNVKILSAPPLPQQVMVVKETLNIDSLESFMVDKILCYLVTLMVMSENIKNQNSTPEAKT